MLNNTKKTRFKITVATIIYCMGMGAYALYSGESNVTTIAIGVVAASGIMYKHSETQRPSNKE